MVIHSIIQKYLPSFSHPKGRRGQIERFEEEIEQERNMADNLVSAMQPGLRERYLELKNRNVRYQTDLEEMNQALDALNSKKIM